MGLFQFALTDKLTDIVTDTQQRLKTTRDAAGNLVAVALFDSGVVEIGADDSGFIFQQTRVDDVVQAHPIKGTVKLHTKVVEDKQIATDELCFAVPLGAAEMLALEFAQQRLYRALVLRFLRQLLHRC